MWFIELGTICVTVAVVVRVWWLVVQVLRARNKRRLLSRMFGVVSDSPDFIGISAICHDIAYIIHSGFISGYQNRYGDNLKPPTNVYHRMTA